MIDDFLINNEKGKYLYNSFAKNMPICDYHCHLSAKDIYENRNIQNITELWLKYDHYKWRVMRSCGCSEEYCTGQASDRYKFLVYAKCLQLAVGNPIYTWSNMELEKYFGISDYLNENNANDIYNIANDFIKSNNFTPQSLIKISNVKIICTTDDPIDDLHYHILLQKFNDFGCKVYPSFRPDNALNIEKDGYVSYIKKLGAVCGTTIKSFDDIVKCLKLRACFFNRNGCKIADHAFSYMPFVQVSKKELNKIFISAMNHKRLTKIQIDSYKTAIMHELGKIYYSLNWAMELHIGVMRNNNTRMYNSVGVDTGFDSVNDDNNAKNLSKFLDSLDVEEKLPKTVLFNLNDKDNIVFATMLGNFQSQGSYSKMQYGPAWWFLDNYNGIFNHLKYLSNLGVLGKFIGMETDSRSFTSFVRHDYFRRILCDYIGNLVEKGFYENDDKMLEKIITDICYYNAVDYFNFDMEQ